MVALNLINEFVHAVRQAGDDAGEDQQAHAVADAAIGDLLAQPHDEGRARGQRQYRHQVKAMPGIQHHAAAGEGSPQCRSLEGAGGITVT